uniref:Uncharacterized protein n=1 Tax=Glossina austeni TaxID=7395 RepID=A0A1A9UU96_GLOAU
MSFTGSFIFLTIESEDSQLLQQQRTLASTKRGGNGAGPTHTLGRSGNANMNSNNIYHNIQLTQQQQQQQQQQQTLQQHLDNGTLVSPAISSSSSSATASLASSSSSSSTSMLEGMLSMNGNNNDFVYGDDATPQYALAPDTYDVRQRTIENIWDITVSLNILYKENWTKLAALEIAKFQDQLIKRLNEDALLQLSPETDVNGNNPATEAVLLYHQHHGGTPAHHLHHSHFYHEWNFAKAFFYSLTVLTTIVTKNLTLDILLIC